MKHLVNYVKIALVENYKAKKCSFLEILGKHSMSYDLTQFSYNVKSNAKPAFSFSKSLFIIHFLQEIVMPNGLFAVIIISLPK